RAGCHDRRRGPRSARLACHEHDGALDLVVGEIAVAAAWRHRLEAVDGVIEGGLLALRDHLAPGRLVADLGRARETGLVARLADLAVDLVAGQHALGT